MSEAMPTLSRRAFVKTTGALGALAAVGGAAATDSLFGSGVAQASADSEEKVTWGHCAINCPGRCALRIHTKDDEVVWVEGDTSDDNNIDDMQVRCCLRGRSYRRWINHPDRLNYPMKRVGRRGEGKFERISWDEAIDTIAEKLKYTIDTYGNEAIYIHMGSGTSSTTARPYWRMFNVLGGSLQFYGSYSTHQLSYTTPFVIGSGSGSTLNVIDDATLYLAFGSNTTVTTQGGGCGHTDYVRMREKTKAKIIHVDPRLTDTVAGHCDEWLPINPGTDAALIAGIAHYLIEHDLVDLDFLHTYCVGYDEETMPEAYKGKNMSYYAYIMGEGYDKVEKTPEWASRITGIAPQKIEELAQEIGTTEALFVDQGYGSQRRSNGEWNCWAIMALPALVGQVGKPGTNSGYPHGSYSISLTSIPNLDNPIKAQIPCYLYTDAIDHGHEMTAKNAGVKSGDAVKSDIKFMFYGAGNCLTNQHGDINRTHDILADESKCEFIVCTNTVLCDSAKYADILLPDSFRFEQVSMIGTGGDTGYMIAGQPCTSRKFERKDPYEIATLISRAMGTEEEFTEGKTQEEWIKELYEKDRAKDPSLPTYDEAMEMGVYKKANPKGKTIALEAFVADPSANPLKTASGKIEIFSESIEKLAETWDLAEDEQFHGLPMYIPEWYGVETTTEENPLVLTGFHYRGRQHSSWGNIDILKEANPQEVWINPADAQERGIASGDTVAVTNDFGETHLLAKVTPRIVPGTVAISQGAWHEADMYGDRVDKGGCINTLTCYRPSPLSKGNPQHSNICQVTKIAG
ncbi:dimethyl sulfoxide reductase subunit A [Rubneribacter badeniensis]|uniref:Dimethyl sulfoxide reductase subunit A n=1 Tax=Rubneribacter badeniensis TaxID=2070688 RepID=A0A2K2U1T1_9ACTN|nr:DMSO/selenate family reductase complex A subunit [Rubneribacter badeniensis]PNV64214.1 dimethyl sulfoxide reductase subunit A [Rubneribacter badeniensis]